MRIPCWFGVLHKIIITTTPPYVYLDLVPDFPRPCQRRSRWDVVRYVHAIRFRVVFRNMVFGFFIFCNLLIRSWSLRWWFSVSSWNKLLLDMKIRASQDWFGTKISQPILNEKHMRYSMLCTCLYTQNGHRNMVFVFFSLCAFHAGLEFSIKSLSQRFHPTSMLIWYRIFRDPSKWEADDVDVHAITFRVVIEIWFLVSSFPAISW